MCKVALEKNGKTDKKLNSVLKLNTGISVNKLRGAILPILWVIRASVTPVYFVYTVLCTLFCAVVLTEEIAKLLTV